jgi:hypothetical protein
LLPYGDWEKLDVYHDRGGWEALVRLVYVQSLPSSLLLARSAKIAHAGVADLVHMNGVGPRFRASSGAARSFRRPLSQSCRA